MFELEPYPLLDTVPLRVQVRWVLDPVPSQFAFCTQVRIARANPRAGQIHADSLVGDIVVSTIAVADTVANHTNGNVVDDIGKDFDICVKVELARCWVSLNYCHFLWLAQLQVSLLCQHPILAMHTCRHIPLLPSPQQLS